MTKEYIHVEIWSAAQPEPQISKDLKLQLASVTYQILRFSFMLTVFRSGRVRDWDCGC